MLYMAPKQKMTHEIWFDFWGVRVQTCLPTLEDKNHLAYYFRDYRIEPAGKSDILINFKTCNNDIPYMKAAASQRSVEAIDSAGNVTNWHGEETVSGPTPLPPFTLKPLCELVTTIHAAAAAPPDAPEHAVLIHGPSMAGKSSLIMALANKGWWFLSDDTVPINSQGIALPFTRPVGIRERTARRNGINASLYKDAHCFSTTVGNTLSVHPSDLGYKTSHPVPVRWVVTLKPATHFNARIVKNNHLILELDIHHHEAEATRAIEKFCAG